MVWEHDAHLAPSEIVVPACAVARKYTRTTKTRVRVVSDPHMSAWPSCARACRLSLCHSHAYMVGGVKEGAADDDETYRGAIDRARQLQRCE